MDSHMPRVEDAGLKKYRLLSVMKEKHSNLQLERDLCYLEQIDRRVYIYIDQKP